MIATFIKSTNSIFNNNSLKAGTITITNQITQNSNNKPGNVSAYDTMYKHTLMNKIETIMQTKNDILNEEFKKEITKKFKPLLDSFGVQDIKTALNQFETKEFLKNITEQFIKNIKQSIEKTIAELEPLKTHMVADPNNINLAISFLKNKSKSLDKDGELLSQTKKDKVPALMTNIMAGNEKLSNKEIYNFIVENDIHIDKLFTDINLHAINMEKATNALKEANDQEQKDKIKKELADIKNKVSKTVDDTTKNIAEVNERQSGKLRAAFVAAAVGSLGIYGAKSMNSTDQEDESGLVAA